MLFQIEWWEGRWDEHQSNLYVKAADKVEAADRADEILGPKRFFRVRPLNEMCPDERKN